MTLIASKILNSGGQCGDPTAIQLYCLIYYKVDILYVDNFRKKYSYT